MKDVISWHGEFTSFYGEDFSVDDKLYSLSRSDVKVTPNARYS